MKLRNLLAGVLTMALAIGVSPSIGSAETPNSYSLTIDDQKLNSPLAPQFRNGVTFVPMRAIFETLGAKVGFNAKSKQVVGQRGNKSITLTLGSKTAYVNKSAVTLQQAPLSLNNNVYVPLRFVSESLGAEVEVNAASKSINIRTAEMDLTVTTELPLLNDNGKPIKLLHPGNVRLKWSFEDESPYQHYQGFAGSDETLIFQSFDEFIVTDYNGKVLSTEAYNDSEPRFVAVKGADGYDIRASKGETTYKWSNIPLYTGSLFSPLLYIDGSPSDYYVSVVGNIDGNGHLIVLTEDGLAAYDEKSELLWVHKEWPTESGTLSAFMEYLKLQVDSKNNVYVQNYEGYAILDPYGDTILAQKGYFFPVVMPDDTFLSHGGSYRLEDGELKLLDEPSGGGGSGPYSSNERENTLVKIVPSTGSIQWTYKQSAAEKQRGYSLFSSTLVADSKDNAYISTTGGTVHALDPQGNLRFKLVIDNRTISDTQILPLSPTTFVAIDNNHVMCFEISNG